MNQLNLNNEYRVVLTEVLPYEIPLMLDNYGFYKNIIDEKKRKIFIKQFRFLKKENEKRWYIPFNYYVRKYGGNSRYLSIMHPMSQLDVVDFYKKYADYMLYLCDKSPFSIRHIKSISRSIFEIEKDYDIGQDPYEEEIETYKEYQSYFMYEQYDRYYKFFEGMDQVRLEQKYKYCMKIDLSKCFYHIYTHSIAWAIKGKDYAKKNNKSDSLECNFDKLMQHCNYNETNGIIVGPEISRIFSEIILQRIDLNILEELKKKEIVLGKNYEIRRYVDDYLVFANDEKIFDTIKKACENQCEPYKLYINEKKVKILSRPFSTDISSAKYEVKELIQEIENKYFLLDDNGNYLKKFSDSIKGITNFVHRFSSIAHQNNVNYSEINRYCLSLIKKILCKESKKNIEPSEGQILNFMEIFFYLFSLDMNASGSVSISRLIGVIVDWSYKISDISVQQKIMDRLYRESKRCFDIYNSTAKTNQTNIEILNLLLVLHRKTKFEINGDLIRSIFDLEISKERKIGFDKLNYFQICTILYVLEKKDNEIYSALIEEIKRRFNEKEEPLIYSELTLLYFDMLTCPYIDENTKIDIYACVQKLPNTPRKRTEYLNNVNSICKVKRWFFDWDKNKDLSSIIEKKEYIPVYQ